MVAALEHSIAELEAQMELLRAQNLDLRHLIEHSGQVFWTVDAQQMHTLYISGGFEQMYDLPVAAQYADPHAFLQVVAPEDAPIVHAALAQQRQGLPTSIEYRVVHRDGSVHWLHDRGAPIFDEQGRHVRTSGIVTDISEQRQVAAAAIEQRRLLRTIIDLLPDSVYVKDLQGRKTLANRVDVHYMGLADESQALGKRDEDVYPPEMAAQFGVTQRQVLEEGNAVINREEWLTVDGAPRCLLTSQVPLRNAEGEVIGLVGVGRDITEYKAALIALEKLNHSLEARVAERTAALQAEIAARQRKEEELALSEQRLRQVIDLVPHMIYAKDIDGRYILANRACAASLGVTVEALIGKRDIDLNPWTEEAERFFREDVQVITSQDILEIPVETIHFHDGSEHQLQTIKIPFTAAGHDKPAVLGVGIDITPVKQAEALLQAYADELQQANVELRNAARLKDEFLATMSHELRTPLSSILGLAEALQFQVYGPLTPRQQQSLKLIENSGRDLLGLINNVLDLSRIEAGQLHLHPERFDVVDLARIAVRRSRDAAAEKGQTIHFEANCDRLTLEGDQRRWLQVLLNLLSNAIKFTSSNGELGVKVEKDEAASQAHLHVWDHGIGIAPDDVTRLFRPFLQLDSALTRQFPGTGLGLALTRRLVELQGGQITVHSKPGEGSTFTVTIPFTA